MLRAHFLPLTFNEIPGRRHGQRWPGIVWWCLAMIL